MNNLYEAFPQLRKIDKILLFFGSNCVGKTSILQQLTKNSFEEEYTETIGINFYSKDLDRVRLSIWDTCGDEITADFVPHHLYKTAICYIIVISYHSKESVDDAIRYIDYVKLNIAKSNAKVNPYIIALINKKDIKDKKFDRNYAMNILREHTPNILIGEISAKDAIGVRKFFTKIENLLMNGTVKENKEDDLFFVNTFKIEEESVRGKNKKKCC